MKNIFKISYISFLFIILLNSNLLSQNNTAYWMKHLPQQINENPAKQLDCKFFIELPVTPNFSLNAFHSGFSINEATMPHPTAIDSFMPDLDVIESVLKDVNDINFETNFSILNMGLALPNDFYITFGINYKIYENFRYPKDLIELRRGNYREDGTPLSFDFVQNFMVHREIFAGVSKEVFPGLTIGGRLKFLSGCVNLKANKMKIDWYTETHQDSMYDWTFDSDFDISTSTPVEWEFEYDDQDQISGIAYDSTYTDDIGSNVTDLIFPGNGGFAIDLGAEYLLYDRFLFSASLIDFGFIKWKTNPVILTQQASFTFSGLDIGKYIGSIEDATTDVDSTLGDRIKNDMIDTLLKVFNPDIEKTAYTTRLNTKIYLGANFALYDWLDFGLLYRGAFSNKSLYSSYTISANTNFFKGWSYSLSYSIMDGLYNNLGMGLAYKVGPVQMYLITDNFSVPFWAMNESDLSDNWLKNSKRANFAFGMNILICKNKYDIGLLE